MASEPSSPVVTERHGRGRWAAKRWFTIAAGLGLVGALLLITPVWIMGNDSDFSCGSVLRKTDSGRQQHCEFIGAYRDRLVATYIVAGLGVLCAGVAIQRMSTERRRSAVAAACVAVPLLAFAFVVAWRASDARPPSLEVEPAQLNTPGPHTFVVAGQRFHDWPVVEIVECSVASSPRPCLVGSGLTVTPNDGSFEVTVTYDVPEGGVGIGAFSSAGDPLDITWLVSDDSQGE